MSFFTLLNEIRPELEARLLVAIERAKTVNAQRFPLDTWLLDEAARRATKGKLMRGGLVIGAFEAFGGTDRRAAVQAASALELYGTGILMQDDVTDHSLTRRGLPTIHVAAAQLAEKQSLREAAQFGDNCGFYVGDIMYFLAQDLISSLETEPFTSLSICRICAEELWLLGLAQLEDVRMSLKPATATDITQDNILAMLAGKTGRYSVAWPLRVGAVLAGISAAATKELAIIGEQIGALYQLRDDELGLFGDPAVTGKSADDDIREGKKTLYWSHLTRTLKPDDKFWDVFGNSESSAASIDKLRTHIRSSAIEQTVRQFMLDQQATLQNKIVKSELPKAVQALLQELTSFVISRTK